MKRTRLRAKAKGPDPIGDLYSEEVARQRKAGNYRKGEWDPHHPSGRLGQQKLFFVFIDRATHERIHASPAWARAEGWLSGVNGTFSKWQPSVVRALERWQELLKELEA